MYFYTSYLANNLLKSTNGSFLARHLLTTMHSIRNVHVVMVIKQKLNHQILRKSSEM